jgi:hypothetical protein
MIRYCNGSDEYSQTIDGLPCDCGLRYDDVKRTMIFPHPYIGGTRFLPDADTFLEQMRTAEADGIVKTAVEAKLGEETTLTAGVTTYRVKNADVQVLEWTGSNVDEMRAFAGLMFDIYEEDEPVGDDRAAIMTAKHSAWKTIYPGQFAALGPAGFFILDAHDLAERYELPVPEGQHPWDYWTGGGEECGEGDCEDYYDEAGQLTGIEQCSHVKPAVATFGDRWVRERLEYLLHELRGAMKRGEDIEAVAEMLDAGVYEAARQFDDEVSEVGRGERLENRRLFAEVIAENLIEVQMAQAVAVEYGIASEADRG